jgi:hypothetical protein
LESELEVVKLLIERARSIARGPSPDKVEQQVFEDCGVLWLALSVNPFTSFPATDVHSSAEEGPVAQAAATVSALRQSCKQLGIEDKGFDSACRLLDRKAATAAADQRGLGQLSESRKTAELDLELGRRVILEYKDRPSGYLVLAGAYEQISKFGWKTKDPRVILRTLMKATEAAHRAARLDPKDQYALLFARRLSEKWLDARLELSATQTEPFLSW